MSGPNSWMPFYFADFWSDTQHLSAVEQCAYFNLLCSMWKNGGFLPNDDVRLQRLSRVTEKEWRTSSATVTAFFICSDGNLTQKRLSEEYAKAIKAYNGRSEHMATVNSRRKQTKPTDTVNTERLTTHNSQSPTGEIQPSAGEEPLKVRIFGECLAWLVKVTRKTEKEIRPLLGKWCSQHGDGATLQAITQSQVNASIDPIPYIERVLKNTRENAKGAEKTDPTQPRSTNRVEWTAYYRGWLRTSGKVWPLHAGPKPGEPGCQCPRDVIAEVDLEVPDNLLAINRTKVVA